MLVFLRLSLGCHFLYEGVWKIKNAHEFTAAPFLTQAKGPFAPMFYAMMYDIDGQQRLELARDDKGRWSLPTYLNVWSALRDRYVARYKMVEEQQTEAEKLQYQFEDRLAAFVAGHLTEIRGYHEALKRFADTKVDPVADVPFQKKRIWDRQQDMRKESGAWTAEVDKLSEAYEAALAELLTEDQAATGPVAASWNPLSWSRIEFVNFAVTYGLTAIGLCLMLGFCTRLACLGGAAFMAFVVMTQPGWPTIYPPAPPVVGHALLVTKDWIEMVALLVLATTAVGRWGGLDFFVYYLFGRPLMKRCGCLKDDAAAECCANR